jgi:hypothetical protein
MTSRSSLSMKRVRLPPFQTESHSHISAAQRRTSHFGDLRYICCAGTIASQHDAINIDIPFHRLLGGVNDEHSVAFSLLKLQPRCPPRTPLPCSPSRRCGLQVRLHAPRHKGFAITDRCGNFYLFWCAEIPPEDEIVEQGKKLIEATESWKAGKTFFEIVHTSSRPKLAGDGAPWFCRFSEHKPSDITFDQLWDKIAHNKAENELQYVFNAYHSMW